MATAAVRDDTFTWTGTDKTGRPSKGEISASSQSMARAQLRRRGINPKSVKKKAKPLFGLGGSGKPIEPADIAVFTRQLATMMKAGVPLVQSFDIVADGIEKESLRDIKKDPQFSEVREEILTMIWDMEEEIMGRA